MRIRIGREAWSHRTGKHDARFLIAGARNDQCLQVDRYEDAGAADEAWIPRAEGGRVATGARHGGVTVRGDQPSCQLGVVGHRYAILPDDCDGIRVTIHGGNYRRAVPLDRIEFAARRVL